MHYAAFAFFMSMITNAILRYSNKNTLIPSAVTKSIVWMVIIFKLATIQSGYFS